MPLSPQSLPRLAMLAFIGTMAMGIGVIISLLADIQERFGFPTWSLGLLAGISFTFTLFANLWLAPLADRGWERVLIVSGAVFTILGLLWMVFAAGLWQWVAARALLGLAEGAMVGSARRVMLSWDPDHQGKALSSILVAFMAGFLLGPPMGGVLNRIGPELPFLAPALVGAALLPFLLFIRPGEYERAPIRLNRRRLLLLPGFLSGFLLAAVPWLTIGVLDATWARYLTDLGAEPLLIGVGFLAIALPSLFFTPLSGRLADRTNPLRLALIGAVVQLPLVAAYGWASGVAGLLAVAALHSVCWSFITPPGQAAVAKVAPAGQAAEAQGIVEAYGLVLASVGAYAAAPIYEAAGPGPLFLITAAALALTPLAVIGLRKRWRDVF